MQLSLLNGAQGTAQLCGLVPIERRTGSVSRLCCQLRLDALDSAGFCLD